MNEPLPPDPPFRTIAVVTSSRADYSHLSWVLKDLAAHPAVELKLIVIAAHLSPQFGNTVSEIERDGFPIVARIECLLSSDSDLGMAKTLGLATLSLADTLAAMRPDILLLIADRYEMLAPACVALTLRIPVAHIEGGEISEGALDDQVRNAITKLAHLHFTSTEAAHQRVISMGEEPWRVNARRSTLTRSSPPLHASHPYRARSGPQSPVIVRNSRRRLPSRHPPPRHHLRSRRRLFRP